MNDRPNFLLFVTDQHRADYLGCYGHPLLRTPHIDSIAARGRRFDRFYVANPVCMPNRATLMTGRMPSLHGVRHNGIPLSLRANTFVELLRAAGYHTALIGKGHLQNMTGRPPVLRPSAPPPGWIPPPEHLREALKSVPGDGPYDQEHPARWRAEAPLAMSLPYYGFEHVELCTEHGDQVGGHYYQWLRTKVADPERLRGPEHALPHDYVCPQAWRTAVPEELYPTSWVADRALDYLAGRRASGGRTPFFAQVSFPDPHHPFTPPGRYWDMYRPDDVKLPRSFQFPEAPPPPHVAWAIAQREAGTAVITTQSAFAVHEREAREAIALTCGMIAMIDDAAGRVLATLEALGLAETTVVIFTTDHGDFLGDHRLMLKGPAHYQGLVRVPFIWADTPDRARPGMSAALCGTLDIAATVLDRAGVAPYNGLQGRSLLPAAAGQDDDESCVVIEDDQQRTYFGFDKPPRLRTIVTRRWRLTIYQDVPWGELYDLEFDPEEMVNLWDDPAHRGVRADLLEQLARRQMALVDRSPLPTAIA